MRTSSVITISLPPSMVAVSGRVAKKKHMTRSELVRTALRNYLDQVSKEELGASLAIESYKKEKQQGTTKILNKSLVDLME